MKFFLYKFIIILFGVFLLYELTIGSKIKHFERNFVTFFSKEQVELIKLKARKEMKSAINKDVYLNPEDAELISRFIKKIQGELDINESN